MKIDKSQWKWIREPGEFSISEDKIEIITNSKATSGALSGLF